MEVDEIVSESSEGGDPADSRVNDGGSHVNDDADSKSESKVDILKQGANIEKTGRGQPVGANQQSQEAADNPFYLVTGRKSGRKAKSLK